MDAAFMMQVKDRVAQATECVASLYEPTGFSNLPDRRALPELLVEFAVGAEDCCAECGAALLGGSSSRICLACGEFQPAAARKPEPFDFNTSLALQLFFDSLNLDGSGLGVKKAAQPKFRPSSIQEDFNYGQANKGAPESLTSSSSSKSKYFAEVEEEDIWESADGEGGTVNWTQQLAEASAGDFLATLPSQKNSLSSVDNAFGQTTTDNFDDYFQAASQPQSQSQSQQHNLDFFQVPHQKKSDVNSPLGEEGLFALGPQSHAAGQYPASTDLFQAFSGNKSPESPAKTSVLNRQSSSDFFNQLEGLNLTRSQSLQVRDTDNESVAAVKSILTELPDLSFMLADRLVVPGGVKKKKMVSMWSFKELE